MSESTRQLRSSTRAKLELASAATAYSNGTNSGGLNFKQSKPSAVPQAAAVKKRQKSEATSKAFTKRPHSPLQVDKHADSITVSNSPAAMSHSTVSNSSPPNINDKAITPKRQKLNKYPPGTTPFPDHPHPTPEEVQTVVDLLSELHGVHTRPPKPPLPDLLVTGCGEVPSVLDAVIRTLLSANTSAQNSNRAFKGLVEKFGVCGKRGSVDWDKVRQAKTEEVYEAIKSGGLANVKSKRIKKILQQVWDEAQIRKKERREKEENKQTGNKEGNLGDDGSTVIARKSTGQVVKQEYHGHQLVTQPIDSDKSDILNTPGITQDTEYESDDDLSLDYLHNLPDNAAMDKLTSFDGIGFKTASCVMLFCMSRDSFAVDTHVFRIARFLNWVPPDKANRETAFWHLDAKLPNEHKYALHQLFIKHGRTCKWCKAGGPLRYEDYGRKDKGKKVKKEGIKEEEEDEASDSSESESKASDQESMPAMCPIEHLVKRFHGASKGRGAKWEE